jgi:hypothetical protein
MSVVEHHYQAKSELLNNVSRFGSLRFGSFSAVSAPLTGLDKNLPLTLIRSGNKKGKNQ